MHWKPILARAPVGKPPPPPSSSRHLAPESLRNPLDRIADIPNGSPTKTVRSSVLFASVITSTVMIDDKVRSALYLVEELETIQGLLQLLSVNLVPIWKEVDNQLFSCKRYLGGIGRCVCTMLNCLAATVLVNDATLWNQGLHHDKRCACLCGYVCVCMAVKLYWADKITLIKGCLAAEAEPLLHQLWSQIASRDVSASPHTTGFTLQTVFPLRKEHFPSAQPESIGFKAPVLF